MVEEKKTVEYLKKVWEVNPHLKSPEEGHDKVCNKSEEWQKWEAERKSILDELIIDCNTILNHLSDLPIQRARQNYLRALIAHVIESSKIIYSNLRER